MASEINFAPEAPGFVPGTLFFGLHLCQLLVVKGCDLDHFQGTFATASDPSFSDQSR